MKKVIFSADDFGMSVEINEAIEIAHTQGLLSTTSLMVAGPAVEDALARAKRLPSLKVGLHLVVIEGPAALPPCSIPRLVGPDGQFPSDQLKLGIRYFFDPLTRRQLRREIRAQFAAFAATGLELDHANAHKHMHLHPTVGRMMIDIGREYGLPAVRIPAEPGHIIQKVEGACRQSLGGQALLWWTELLRHQVRRAGLKCNDSCFGLAWSGHMTQERITKLLGVLPEGVSEIYFHPATQRNGLVRQLMPDYEHMEELRALISPGVHQALKKAGAQKAGWSDI